MSDDLPQRRPTRLPAFDYTQAGGYFVTICTHRRSCILGEIVDTNRVVLSSIGRIVDEIWSSLPSVDPNVALDEFVIMPNHVHGILMLHDGSAGLPAVVATFKSLSTRRVNAPSGRMGDRLWQRSYHEHVIRSDRSLERIRDYIAGNPAKWQVDRENPANWVFAARRAGQARPLQIASGPR